MKAKIGDTYEHLTVEDEATYKDACNRVRSVYFCRCKCGLADIRVTERNWGQTKSCGCRQRILDNQKRRSREKRHEVTQQEVGMRLDAFITGYKPDAQAS